MACTARIERGLVRLGARLVAGADEVGRGAVAGPVVAAACILNLGRFPRGLDDSKKLTRLQREALVPQIERSAVAFAVARIEHDEIDRINIHHASLRAIGLAVKALQPKPDYVLIDGRFTLPDLDCPQQAIIKGDARSVSIAAASILAKVARDRWMSEYDGVFPGYDFASHVGYHTARHREAIGKLGPCAIHRVTFQGVLERQLSLFESAESSVAADLD